MRWFFSLLLLGWLGVASAISSTGNRLLVILEELAEKDNYSKFFNDLKGKLALWGTMKYNSYVALNSLLMGQSIRSGVRCITRIAKERKPFSLSSRRESL